MAELKFMLLWADYKLMIELAAILFIGRGPAECSAGVGKDSSINGDFVDQIRRRERHILSAGGHLPFGSSFMQQR